MLVETLDLGSLGVDTAPSKHDLDELGPERIAHFRSHRLLEEEAGTSPADKEAADRAAAEQADEEAALAQEIVDDGALDNAA